MIWRKAALKAIPPMDCPKIPRKIKDIRYQARAVLYAEEEVLELDFFKPDGTLILRHWVEKGCKSCISYDPQEDKWGNGPLEKQEAVSAGGWRGLEPMAKNPDASEIIKEFLPLREHVDSATPDRISWEEDWGEHLKRRARENRREEVANELKSRLSRNDTSADDAVKKVASRKIFEKRGTDGWMATWKYRKGRTYQTRGRCTICDSEMDLHSEDVQYCPECLMPVEPLYATPAGKSKTWETTVLQFKRSEKGYVLAIQYRCGESCEIQGAGKYREVTVSQHQEPAYVVIFFGKEIYGYENWAGDLRYTKTAQDRWPEVRIVPDWPIFEGTALQNSHVWDYIAAVKYPHPIGYCRRYLTYPGIETLSNAGLWSIIENVIQNPIETRRNINLKAKSPAKILGLSRPEIAQCASEQWNVKHLSAYRWLRTNNLPTTKEEVEAAKGLRDYSAYRDLIEKIPNREKEVYKYLKRQNQKSVKTSRRTLVMLYRDYLEFAEKLDYDLNNEKNRYPDNLEVMHDRLSEQVSAQKNAANDEKIKAVASRLERYTWEQDGLLIRPARSAQELINEGKILNHCVGTYVDRYAEEKTALFFVRRAEEPDVPFYTLELREETMTVVQNHGYRNTLQTPEVKAFEEKWLKWAKKQKAKVKASQKEKKQTPAA